MAIAQAVCNSFKNELFLGEHDFSTQIFKIALYTSAANLGASTTAYSATNEVVATSGVYTPGGQNLTVTAGYPQLDGSVSIITFASVTWPSVTLTARGALIYNSSLSNKAVAVLDFGADKTATNGSFVILFPAANSTTAILRLS